MPPIQRPHQGWYGCDFKEDFSANLCDSPLSQAFLQKPLRVDSESPPGALLVHIAMQNMTFSASHSSDLAVNFWRDQSLP